MLVTSPMNKGELERGAELLTQACDASQARACFIVGAISHYGRLGDQQRPRDYVAARRAYETACRAGHTEACYRIAQFLYDGKGGPQDLFEARSLFGALCKQDVGTACFFYGNMQQAGEGGELDLSGSKKSIAKGCDLGDRTACAAKQ